MSVIPAEYEKLLGHTFVTRQNQTALQIGEQKWSRWELANVFGLANFRAAGTLTMHLRRLGVKNLEQLYAISPEELAAIKGVGETGAYVAASILKENKFDAKHWAGYGPNGAEPVTFRTLKIRKKERHNGRRRTGVHGGSYTRHARA